MDNGNRVYFSAAALVALTLATSAVAQPPDAAPGKSDQPARAAEKAEAKAARAEAKAARAEAKAEREESKAAGERDKADGGPAKGDGDQGRGPLHGGHAHGRGGFRALGEDFRHGRVKKAELKERLAAMRASAGERRREHQKALEKRWGAALANTGCRESLRLHARRGAFLSRALFVAETEVTKDKAKTIERIEKLIAREDARHARAMERCAATPGGSMPPSSAAPAPSAAPPASAAPPVPAMPSASAGKAGER